MKKLLFYLFFAIALIFGCKYKQEPQKTTHEAQWNADGKDSVVYVNYRQDDGSFLHFYMQYLLFQSLFNSGGYTNVYHYYQTNPSYFNDQSRYHSYSSSYSPSHRTSGSATKSYSSPSRSSSSSYTPSKSYSPPSRSYTPTRSYSPPSRSYTPSVRSYSSPSRH